MLELIKDYNFEIHYHLGKANVVADALSRKFYDQHLIPMNPHLHGELSQLKLHIVHQP